MTGITLLKNIKKGKYSDGTRFIFYCEDHHFNNCNVYYDDNELYINLFGQKTLITINDLLIGEFVEDEGYFKEIFDKAISRLLKTRKIENECQYGLAIVELEKEIDYYRRKIRRMTEEKSVKQNN